MTLAATLDILAKGLVLILPILIALLVKRIERVSRKVEELHVSVNSRLTQLLEQTAQASEARGRAALSDEQSNAIKVLEEARVVAQALISTAAAAADSLKMVAEANVALKTLPLREKGENDE